MHFIKLFQPIGKSFSLFFNISIENETLKDMYIYNVFVPFILLLFQRMWILFSYGFSQLLAIRNHLIRQV